MYRPIVGVIVLGVFLLSGCLAETDSELGGPAAGDAAGKGWEEVCLQRWDCTGEVAECHAERATQCDLCWANCAYSNTCDGCSRACSGSDHCTCTHSADYCVEWEYRMLVPADRDEALYAACSRNWERGVECGAAVDPVSACDRFARIERPEMAAVYQCAAEAIASSCEADVDTACPSPRDAAFADELCGALECTDELRSWLAAEGGWLRDDIKQTARNCLAEHRTERAPFDCLLAWAQMVAATT